MAEPFEESNFASLVPELRLIPGSRQDCSQPDTGNSQTVSEKWLHPRSSREIAEILNTDRRNISNWYLVVRRVYCWLPEAELKIGAGKATRYTPFCCQQFESLQAVTGQGKGYDDWIASVHQAYPEAIAAYSAQTADPDIISSEALPPGNRSISEQAMLPYQPSIDEIERFTPPDRKFFRYTTTGKFVDSAKRQTEQGIDVTQSNSCALADSLINQMHQEGQKLGLTLFQAKYGTAQAVMAELEQTLAKKSGLVEEPQPAG